jgi:CBS domain-containing protein
MKAGTQMQKSAAKKKGARKAKVAKAPARKAKRAPAVASARSTVRHARDVMTANPVCAETGANLRDVAKLLDEYEISGLPVVDDQERLVGVISRMDLVHRLIEGPADSRRDETWLDLLTADSASTVDVDVARLGTVDDLMSIDPVVAKPEETLATIARRMAEERVHRVVVVENNHPVGILTTLDVLKYFPS